MNDMDLGFTLPSSQSDRDKIKKNLEEVSGQLQMIADRKEQIKEIIEATADEYKIPKKILSKIATTMFKNQYAEASYESSIFELVYEGIIGEESTPKTSYEDDEG